MIPGDAAAGRRGAALARPRVGARATALAPSQQPFFACDTRLVSALIYSFDANNVIYSVHN